MKINKNIVYSERIRDIEHLNNQNDITEAVATNNKEMIERTWAEIAYVCRATNGAHIETYYVW